MIRATFRTRPTRELCFDLESRPSAYWYEGKTTAEITAFGWKWGHERSVRTLLLTADGDFEDAAGGRWAYSCAYESFRETLCGADLVFGHNIRGFDLPLFQAGLLRLKLPPLPHLVTTDTLRDYPRRKDMSASLANLAAIYLGGEGKLHMSQVDWERANRLETEGRSRARKRVASDVLLQERLRRKLLGLGLLREPRIWRPS